MSKKTTMFFEYPCFVVEMPSIGNSKQGGDFSQFQTPLFLKMCNSLRNFIPNPISEKHKNLGSMDSISILLLAL